MQFSILLNLCITKKHFYQLLSMVRLSYKSRWLFIQMESVENQSTFDLMIDGTTRYRKHLPLRCWITSRLRLAWMRYNIFWVHRYFIISRIIQTRLTQLADEPFQYGRPRFAITQSRTHLRQHWQENQYQRSQKTRCLCEGKNIVDLRLYEDEKNVNISLL